MQDSLRHRLQERVKELTALHRAARLLQETGRDLDEVMPEVVFLLPAAWQHPEHTEARLTWGARQWSTPGFAESPWQQREEFQTRDGRRGSICVAYTVELPAVDEGPFLCEERDLIRSLADMLRAHFQHREDDAAIVAANDRLELQVAERTARLRRLSREVTLAEERERRHIAEDLHDHLGQALAVLKIRLQRLRADAMLGGHEQALSELVELSDQAIRYTRSLTFELSPPILYELGLGPALEWFGERVAAKHGLQVAVRIHDRTPLPDDLKVMLWKCARELVHNVIKHAQAGHMTLDLDRRGDQVVLEVADDGRGFDPATLQADRSDHFGLLAIEERLRDDGGGLDIEARPGHGTRVRLHADLPGGGA